MTPLRFLSLRASPLAVLLLAGSLCAVFPTGGGAAPAVAPQMPPQRPTQITIFDQPNYKGHSMVFDRSVPSLAALNFNDRVASVQIKGPRDWVLCEHRNFQGRCERIRAKANNLKRVKLEGQVSSLYPVPDPPPKVKHR